MSSLTHRINIILDVKTEFRASDTKRVIKRMIEDNQDEFRESNSAYKILNSYEFSVLDTWLNKE